MTATLHTKAKIIALLLKTVLEIMNILIFKEGNVTPGRSIRSYNRVNKRRGKNKNLVMYEVLCNVDRFNFHKE